MNVENKWRIIECNSTMNGDNMYHIFIYLFLFYFIFL